MGRRLALAFLCLLALSPAGPSAAAGGSAQSANPFLGTRLFVDPDSPANRQVRAWRERRPGDAARIAKLASQPSANWLGDWLPDAPRYVRWWISAKLRPARATAFFAVYDLPHRDCSGHYSHGGVDGGARYRRWIDGVARAIGDYPAVVVIEPDGLPDANCLAPAARRERFALEAYATRRLAALGHTSVYIDAGRSDWRPAREMVAYLRAADVRAARGFSLDVTGYASTSRELRYGDAIARALGAKHFIVNTSRNGRGALAPGAAASRQQTWCNTPGRALGARPTTRTADRYADAFEWVLHPGYSDGFCGGGPKAGTWWPSYALGLARRAPY